MKLGFHNRIVAVTGILAVVAFLAGCGSSLQNPTPSSQSPGVTGPAPSSLQAQTRVVLAEMFTGDW
ncbi:hypothetical protein Dform_00322 [Dehalogenimonas formicexedens]|uniref:Uncharacterized protein n=1 Tax=Dehalogenimonas formicexedens TaxID=1839801 RepID=A0A1P8F5Q7_9CHLR|nr:hypothetical protein [Dehalogenimonas formicexedens]APV43682.1 hypothetical protein Dform_00322 [Dehalogenimonas formicexedens]